MERQKYPATADEVQPEEKEEEKHHMRKIVLAVALSALLLGFSTASLAQSPLYVLTNDDNNANSASLFNLNTANGKLSLVKTLDTSGQAYQGGYYAGATQIISPDGACIFVADGASNDIAAFSKATGYSKVGNYSDASLQGASNMPMIENSAGTLLYAAYEGSSNIAVWTVNPDCSLVVANIYSTQSFLGSMAITHDGRTLLATYEIVNEAGSFAISGSTLTDNGEISTGRADVTGIAALNNDSVVIMGTAYNKNHPSELVTANIPGFTHQKHWTLGPGYSAGSIALSPAAANGKGCLYIGNTGDGTSGTAGVTGVSVTEDPINLVYVNNVTSKLPTFVGTVVTITNQENGAGVYAAESAGYIGVYTVDLNCAVTLVRETPDPNSTFMLSLTGSVQ
jgi:hypothetical protein